ncbi:MAG: glycosyltransferase family 8 protein [Rhizobiaceae bacterium]|nr:glycosyltransferase family 8 protein [Rhizobiaceae bacterium]
MKTPLVLACDDKFIPYAAVVARRAAHLAAEKFPIIVVSDGVSDENKRLAQKFCPQISFIEAGFHLHGKSLPERDAFTRAAYLRLFLDVILSDFERAVYLDCDLSPLVDLSPLLAMVPEAAPVIAAYDLPIMISGDRPKALGMTGGYFNSGVLVLDLKALRTQAVFTDALSFALDHADLCRGADQDPLNAVLDGRWQVLDWRWNVLTYMNDLLPEQPFIRHFAGRKPWGRNKAGLEKQFVDQWRDDLAQSPWPGRLFEEPFEKRVAGFYRRAESLLRGAKTIAFANASGKRGRRSRFLSDFPAILSGIEEAAQAASLAKNISP